jgi:acetyl-CoA synthetase (ADP-forming)
MVLFGLGGILTEILDEVTLEPAPLTPSVAAEMIRRTRVGPIAAGVRGRPPLDVDAMADMLVRLGDLACMHPEVAEIDLNPVFLRARGAGAWAADALVVATRVPASAPSPDRQTPKRRPA